ncbi:uncharacterized protein LOC110090344 [Pogona vitticeps]
MQRRKAVQAGTKMSGTHAFLPGAASAQNKQELYEELRAQKDSNPVLSPYSVWRPSRLLEPVPKEEMKEFKSPYQAVKDPSQLAREGMRTHTLPGLGGKTREASESSGPFGRPKGQIPMEEDAHSLEIKRQHFRHFCYKEIEGPRAVLSELQELCHQWLVPERHTKEQIVDLVILEQFLTILPLEMQIWVCKSGPATCAQALALAESFLLRLQESENCEQKGTGLVEEAFVHSPTSEQEMSDAVEICISAEEEEEAILMGAPAAPVPEAGTSQLETPVLGAAALRSATKSPTIVQVRVPEVAVPEQDAASQSKAAAPRRKIPWSGFEQAFTYVRQKGKNLIVQCNYCLPAIKNVSSAITSSSNLKKHLERAHPEKLRLIESAKRGRRRGYSEELKMDDNSPALKIPKQLQQQQTAVERWGCSKESVTQRILDKKIIDFIVEETLPLQIVDKPSFVRLVLLGLPKDLTIMCAKTLKDRIEKRAASMRDTLANRMGAVEYVATTVDCWLDGKRSFLGVTAHWISPTTLKREFAALACKRVKGSLSQHALAKALRDVHMQYRVHNKVVCATTDSGSNFVKALRVFRGKEPGDAADGSADEEDGGGGSSNDREEAEVEFVPISERLHTGIKAEKEATEDFGLPAHQRCVSHTLHLVATQDLEALISDSSENSPLGPFRKHFSSLMGKCRKLWSKQTQSAQIVQYIHQQCGVCLKLPNKASWNSTFEALKQLNELLSTVPLKMDAVMDQCSLARITPAESLVVAEYTEIMGPLAQSLDILQRENGMFMGYLLPTLYNLDRKLQGLENKPVRYTYCFPLLRGLREALQRRFAPIWEDRKLLLAACLHPRFKVDWLESAQTAQTNRYMMEALVKAEIRGTVGEDSEGSSEKDQEGDSLEDDFFNIRPRGRKSAVDIADEEVSDYLRCPSREVSSLHAFPRVMQTFLKYNTGLPSSAAVHRLFGTESSAVTVNGFSMCDKLFEQLVLLKQNKAVF